MLSPLGPDKLDSDTWVSPSRSPENSSLLGVPAKVPFSVSMPFVDKARMTFFTCHQYSDTKLESL